MTSLLRSEIEVGKNINLDCLQSRLFSYFRVQSFIKTDEELNQTLALVGYSDKIDEAKTYSGLYVKPQEILFKQIHSDFVPLFKSESLVRRIEKQHNVVILYGFHGELNVELRGTSMVNNMVCSLINSIHEDASSEIPIAQISEVDSKLQHLCDRFSLSFSELSVANASVKFALVKYLEQEEEVSISEVTSYPVDVLNTSDIQITSVHYNRQTTNNCVPKKRPLQTSSEDNRKVFNDCGVPVITFHNTLPDGDNQPSSSTPAVIQRTVTSLNNTTVDDDLEMTRVVFQKKPSDVVYIGSDSSPVPIPLGNNMFLKIPSIPQYVIPENLRHIVIDASNVAFGHGRNQVYSVKGIIFAIEYFLKRGHRKITGIMPRFRQRESFNALERLEQLNYISFSPSRTVNNLRQMCYDDRMIVQLAMEEDGIIVSNDQYRDLMQESDAFKRTIEQKLLMYTFVGDNFMVPHDPHGARGPTLDQLLRKDRIV